MDRPLTVRERVWAWWRRWRTGDVWMCYRCLMPRDKGVHPHATPISRLQAACPLCESCWGMLTAEERLRYYKATWTVWHNAFGDNVTPWEVLRAACLHERPVQVVSYADAKRMFEADPCAWISAVVTGPGLVTMVPQLPPEVLQAWKDAGVGSLSIECADDESGEAAE